ncbi:hypothetical protein UVI_02014000 [Ustilaginoidea virens]|uniref:GTPase-activating protein GYP5 n=1 Tax=Ustilaginoidea virens TaxID=1159556 RepID=A0A1B5KRJ6_USTVR|nr:hypothetical protein UVI_02014000 [Ustilaginoidea virens]
MSLQGGEEASSALHEDHSPHPSSAADSDSQTTDGQQDSFEDAIDNADRTADAIDAGSARSLTRRSASVAISSPPQPNRGKKSREEDGVEEEHREQQRAQDEHVNVINGAPKQKARRTSSALSNRIADASNLDNINLDDEGVAKVQDMFASRTLSLSSITNALGPSPWPPTAESPSKSPARSLIAVASPAQPPLPPLPPLPALPQHPGPPSRKLTSPFSWLSRSSSSKDKDSPPMCPGNTTGRRNTASSIATLTSNPEMMLSKLDEQNKADNGSQRESLKDRFKALRMREEAGIHLITGGENDGHGDGFSLAHPVGEHEDKSPLTPVPNPNHDLAPGTASGVNAGPSAMQEAQVDWDLWQSVVYEGPAAVARTSPEELNIAIATGIPNAIRGVIWQVLSQSKNERLEAKYRELVVRGTDKEKRRSDSTTSSSTTSNHANVANSNGDGVNSSASSVHSNQSHGNGTGSPQSEKSQEASAKAQAAAEAEKKKNKKKKQKVDAAALQKLERIIRRDLGARTSYSKYAAAAGLQEGLFGVCKAYALFDEDVGYAQGMNFLIMPLLFNMPEEEAFCLLVRLMHQYQLRDLFVHDMPGLHLHLYQFERLLEDLEPALYCHLHRRGISPHLYATQWFLTLFAYRFPLQLVLRIYDLIFSEGLSAILRFGIVLMQKNSSTLLKISDMQQLTTFLKDKLFDVYIDKDPSQGSILENGFFGSSSSSLDKEVYRADQLVKDACEVKITPETLKTYTSEWVEKTKADKDRETELQDLRLANQNFSIQLRKLEERVQAGDTEQAALATELVHTKVENEELRDENESLKGQVKELRNVIEKQPAEIEGSWRLERDDLMKRNEKVHEENQKLEKEMAELEEELIQTKMQYAEVR